MQLLGGSKHIKTFVGQNLERRSGHFDAHGDASPFPCVRFDRLICWADVSNWHASWPTPQNKGIYYYNYTLYIYIEVCIMNYDYSYYLQGWRILLILSVQQELPPFHIKGHVFSPTDVHSIKCLSSIVAKNAQFELEAVHLRRRPREEFGSTAQELLSNTRVLCSDFCFFFTAQLFFLLFYGKECRRQGMNKIHFKVCQIVLNPHQGIYTYMYIIIFIQ